MGKYEICCFELEAVGQDRRGDSAKSARISAEASLPKFNPMVTHFLVKGWKMLRVFG